jgi:DinB superfamily
MQEQEKGTVLTSEDAFITAAVNSWKFNTERADKLFSPLTEEQLLQEVAPGKNRLIYLWGHLTAVHDRMLPLLILGQRLHPEFDAPFLTSPDKSAPALPTAPAIKKAWEEVNGRLLAGFQSLSAAAWLEKHAAVSDEDFAQDPKRNRFSVLLSRTTHISFHLGQTVLVPK